VYAGNLIFLVPMLLELLAAPGDSLLFARCGMDSNDAHLRGRGFEMGQKPVEACGY